MNLVRLICGICALALSHHVSAAQPDVARQFKAADQSYSFSYPATWGIDEITEMNGVLLIAPDEEANWQGNMFFEVRVDEEGRELAEAASDLVPNLQSRKAGFQLLRSSEIVLPSGRKAALIEYTHHKGVGLTAWEVLIPMRARKILFVNASTATSVKHKYQPIFKRVLDSLEVAKD